MPRGDGTGPAGMGPMTGRAAGYCAGYSVPGYMNPVPGRGFGRGMGFGWGRGFGRGMGFGWGWRRGGFFGQPYAAPGAPVYAPTAEQEADALRGQAEYMEESLGELRKRISELEAQSAKKE